MTSGLTSARPIQPQPLQVPPFPPGKVFRLPGGFVENGRVHREVEVGPLTGGDEEFLASVDPATPAAVLITALLAHCIRRIGTIWHPGAEVVRNLLIGDREFLVLKLRQTTLGDRVALSTPCPHEECGEVMDMTFSLKDFPVEERPVSAEPYRLTPPAGDEIVFRLPTGGDQEALVALADDPRVADQLLARCVLQAGSIQSPTVDEITSLPEMTRRLLEERIAALAPEVSAEVETECPECRRPFSPDLDLPALFLAEFQNSGRAMAREVHFLALHYHWPEEEILRMTRTKRRRYIDLLTEELEGIQGV